MIGSQVTILEPLVDVKGFGVTLRALFSSRNPYGHVRLPLGLSIGGALVYILVYQLDWEELNKEHRGVLQFARMMLVLASESLSSVGEWGGRRGLAEVKTDSQRRDVDGKIIKFVGYLVLVPFQRPPLRRTDSYARFALLSP